MLRAGCKGHEVRRIAKLAYLLPCVVLVSSCDYLSGKGPDGKSTIFDPRKHDLIDQELALSREDYKSFTDPDGPRKNGAEASAKLAEPPVPDLAEILAAPKPPKLGETQLISLSVTDDVPLKDVLIELSRLADVDIEIDAGIAGGVNFHAKERPFNEVIERLSDLAGLRYSMKNGVLRVERDTEYVQVYSLDFLNIERSASGSVNISTNVLSSGGGSGGSGSSSGGSSSGGSSSGGSSSSGGGASGLNTGSSETVTTKAESDFWKQFEESVKHILTYRPSKRISEARVVEQPNAPAAPAAEAGRLGADAAPAPAASSGSGVSKEGFYIINREASTLTVSATGRQQELVAEFLRRIRANASSQVLIEAKIVEVTLDDQFQSGIDWTKFTNGNVILNNKFGGVTDGNNAATYTFLPGRNLTAAVELAQTFGTTRTLSSPRLHAINNQQAVLTFAENRVYFSITATQTQQTSSTGATTPGPLTVSSTAHTVPIGIIMTLQPSINTETNEVTLNVRPTLSRITGSVSDPAVSYTLALAAQQDVDITGVSAAVPIIEVRELDSILKLKSGQVMVIGGLMQDIGNNLEKGVPGVSGIPWVGNLFKGVDKKSTMSELVIFIRATIVDSAGNATPADRKLYEKFTKDPRPLNF